MTAPSTFGDAFTAPTIPAPRFFEACPDCGEPEGHLIACPVLDNGDELDELDPDEPIPFTVAGASYRTPPGYPRHVIDWSNIAPHPALAWLAEHCACGLALGDHETPCRAIDAPKGFPARLRLAAPSRETDVPKSNEKPSTDSVAACPLGGT